ncbi:hypothetical protein VNO77_16086 [Canavalia gladiata]|uniref:DUF4283 domain-containing protein n=1 Tax=Canavalia gladiata TaxID=3824 RepID=A0AAN9QRT0_CANGL
MDGRKKPSEMILDSTPFWIHLENGLFAFRSESMIQKIGCSLGTLKTWDTCDECHTIKYYEEIDGEMDIDELVGLPYNVWMRASPHKTTKVMKEGYENMEGERRKKTLPM